MARWDHNLLSLEDGKTLSYYRADNQDKQTIILAHGLTDNALCWSPLIYQLQHDFDVISYDAYGHGLSNPVRASHIFNLPGDLAQLITMLQLEQPILWGHSMGAVTVASYVANFENDAKMIILEDPAWMDDLDLLPSAEEMAAGVGEVQRMQLAHIVSMYQRDNLKWAAEEPLRMAVAREQFDLNFFKHNLLRDWEWRDTIKNIKCPMLLMTGDPEKGGIVTPEIAEYVQAYKSDMRHINVPAAGHCIRRDKPAYYFEVTTQFIQQHS